MAAGTVTITEERLSNVKKITFAWTAGTAGEAGTASGQTTYPYSGNLLKVVTVPGTGDDAPDVDYDITITDEDSVDVANAQLVNRSQTLTQWVASSLGSVTGDKLTINVTNAGSANKGTCIAYIGLVPTEDEDTAIEDALYGTTGVASFPSAAVPANNVSLAEVLRSVWAGLMGTAAGENGITTWPAAAAPGNAVSLAEGLRYIVESQLGTISNTGGSGNLGALLGDFANETAVARFEELEQHAHNYGRWFGLAGTPAAETHRADRIGTTVTAFQINGGNNTWGSWLQILGSSDTPAVVGKTKFDLHKLTVTAAQRASVPYLVQIAFGETAAGALTANTYTEFVYWSPAATTREAPIEFYSPRAVAGTKVWARCWAVTQNQGTLDFFFGLHEYD